MKITLASGTDIGQVRIHNEDRFFPGDKALKTKKSIDIHPQGKIFAVADGMGGTLAGEVAAELAIEAVQDSWEKNLFRDAHSEKEIQDLLTDIFLTARKKLISRVQEDIRTEGMGTTLVVGFILDDRLHLAWLGDSRCYLFRSGSGLQPLTKDHSYVQWLVDAGVIDLEDAFDHHLRNVITRSLMGVEVDDPTPDLISYALQQGDRLVFCSDGLNSMLWDHEIEQVMHIPDTQSCMKQLILAANAKGGHDNITVIVVDVL